MQLALKRTHHPSDTFMVWNMQLLYFAKDCKLFHHSQKVLLRRHCYIHFLSYCILTEKKHVMRGSGMKAVNACKSKAWWRWCSSHRHYLSNLSSPSSDKPGDDQMTYLTIIQPYNHSTEEPRPYQTLLKCMSKPMPCLDCFSRRFSLAWVPHWHRQPAYPLMTSLLCTSLKDHQDKPSPQALPDGVQSNHFFSFDLFAIWHMGNWGYS